MKRMRLLKDCYKEILAMDSNTAVTPFYIRTLVLQNKVPVHMAGRKRLINLDALIEYLENYDADDISNSETGKIRKLG